MPVRPTEHALLRGGIGGFDTYEVYAADSESEAATFLESFRVHEGQYYVVVEFPNGVLGRDRGGIYRPSAGWRGDDWTAMKYDPRVPDTEGQFWRQCPPEFRKQTQPLEKKKWWQLWK